MKNQAFVEFQAIEQAIAIVSHYAQAPEPAKFRGRPTWLSFRCWGAGREPLPAWPAEWEPPPVRPLGCPMPGRGEGGSLVAAWMAQACGWEGRCRIPGPPTTHCSLAEARPAWSSQSHLPTTPCPAAAATSSQTCRRSQTRPRPRCRSLWLTFRCAAAAAPPPLLLPPTRRLRARSHWRRCCCGRSQWCSLLSAVVLFRLQLLLVLKCRLQGLQGACHCLA